MTLFEFVIGFFAIVVCAIFLTGYGFVRLPREQPREAVIPVSAYGPYETVRVFGRTPIAWYWKINPVWWFLNDEDPYPNDWHKPHSPEWWRILSWYIRNPLHNFGLYVIGVCDRNYLVWGHAPVQWAFWTDLVHVDGYPKSGWKLTIINPHGVFVLPGVTYSSDRIEAAIGWRAGGRFAMKFNIRNLGFQLW